MWCIFRELGSIDDDTCILVPRAHNPSGLWQGSWALGTRMMALDNCSSKGASSTSGGVIRRLGDQRRGDDRREAQV